MRTGDILSLPVNPTVPEKRWRWANAKVMKLEKDTVELQFVDGEKDGFEFTITLDELDALLDREGGEDWKRKGKGGS